MSARIARGGRDAGKAARRARAARGARAAGSKAQGLLDTLRRLAGLPRGGSATGRSAALIARASCVAARARVPPAAARRHRARRGGRRRRLHARAGRDHGRSTGSSRLAVYDVAFDQQSMAMPLVDLDATRDAAAAASAGSARRGSRGGCPTRWSIDIVERQPAAIWQNNRQLSLIDADGVVLEPVRLDAMPDLPLVIGPDANRHIGALSALLAGGAAAQAADRRRDLGRPAPLGPPLPVAARLLPCPKARTRRAARSPASRRWTSRTRCSAAASPGSTCAIRGATYVRISREPGAIDRPPRRRRADPGAGRRNDLREDRSDGADAHAPRRRPASWSPRSTSARPRSAR